MATISRYGVGLAVLSLCLLFNNVAVAEATSQDMQVVGRALSFKIGQKRGTMSIAIVYNGSDRRSEAEMKAAMAVLGSGLKVGNRLLRAVVIEQGQLASASVYDGIFTTSAIDQVGLRYALGRYGIPCFSLDLQQVSGGACTIAVRSRPVVSVYINSDNAAAAGVSFATAFMMMVREL